MLAKLLKSIRYRVRAVLQRLVDQDFHEVVNTMTIIDTLLFLIIQYFDKVGVWYKLPVVLGLLHLSIRRHLYQRYNLFNVGATTSAQSLGIKSAHHYSYRTADGKFNDPFNHAAGATGSFFGRNILIPIHQTNNTLLRPDPMVVATKLLGRRKLIDSGKQLNMIAVSWIQFMVHDWIDHLEDTEQVELVAPREVANHCPLKSFKFFKTKQIQTGSNEIKTGSVNTRTPWWDGSVIYGNDAKGLEKVRTYKEGKLKIGDDGLLLHDNDNVAISGDVRNSWAGVSVLQALFIKEHNAVCDALMKEYPELEDEELYHHARLVTSAVIAKLHTIDWTVELLNTDTLLAGMRAIWYGILGKKLKETFGHFGGPLVGGLVGSKRANNHGIPYSLTEEFSSVYRMHSLLPDDFHLRDVSVNPDHNKSPPLICKVAMTNMVGAKGEEASKKMGFTALLVSMGHQSSGALELWNYPLWLRDLTPHDVDAKDRPEHVDLAALDVYRDRERNVGRYNSVRRGMLLKPIFRWEDLTDNKEAIEALRDVYGEDVEELDLIVGLMAENKIKGFAISETAFMIFLLMATRRIEADKFFTSHFNEETYTKKGMEWVKSSESLKDVIERHYPEISEKWINSSSSFSVWDSPPTKHSTVPLYLRIPH